jgi:ribosome-associated toxin RatA of RatAB toxin-antitoxin module
MRWPGRLTLFVLTALASSAAGAQGRSPVPSLATDPVTVVLTEARDGAVTVEGRIVVAVRRSTAWSTLTDYEHMPEFISAMRSSKVLSRRDCRVVVAQESVGRVLFVRRNVHVTLEVEEQPQSTISFEDVSHETFEVYRGSWTVEDAGAETVVVYRVSAKPALSVPGVLLRGAYRRTVRELLEELRLRMMSEGNAQVGGDVRKSSSSSTGQRDPFVRRLAYRPPSSSFNRLRSTGSVSRSSARRAQRSISAAAPSST